jgi:hypothetical protein
MKNAHGIYDLPSLKNKAQLDPPKLGTEHGNIELTTLNAPRSQFSSRMLKKYS